MAVAVRLVAEAEQGVKVLDFAVAQAGVLAATVETAETALQALLVAPVRAEVVGVGDIVQLVATAEGVEAEPEFLVKAQMARAGLMAIRQVQEAEVHAEPVEAALVTFMLGRAGRTVAVAVERKGILLLLVVARVEAAQSVLSGPVQHANSHQPMFPQHMTRVVARYLLEHRVLTLGLPLLV